MSILAQTVPNNTTTIAGPLAVVTDGNQQVGNITANGNVTGGARVLGAIASSTTIKTDVAKSSAAPAAAVTGIILAPGTVDGQDFALVNLGTSSSTITFAAAGTSNVQGGTGVAIAITSVALFVWDAGAALWYLA